MRNQYEDAVINYDQSCHNNTMIMVYHQRVNIYMWNGCFGIIRNPVQSALLIKI